MASDEHLVMENRVPGTHRSANNRNDSISALGRARPCRTEAPLEPLTGSGSPC